MARSSQSFSRHALRFLASVLTVTGILVIADVVLTLTWQEPLSSFLAERQQDRLEDALARAPRRGAVPDPRRGEPVAKITLPTQNRSYVVVEGTDTGSLRKGPGHYSDTPLPGRRGTVAIAGHRTTYLAPFRKVNELERGDPIVLDMVHGRFVYRVEKTRIVQPDQTEVKRRVGYDRLILTACHPLYSAAERIVVFARLARREPTRLTQEGRPAPRRHLARGAARAPLA